MRPWQGGGQLVEWLLPNYDLRPAMLFKAWNIEEEFLQLPELPGLGLELSREIEERYPFRGDATYSCLVDPLKAPQNVIWSF